MRTKFMSVPGDQGQGEGTEEPVVAIPSPWDAVETNSFTMGASVAGSLTEEQKTAINTIDVEHTTFIRGNLAITNSDKTQTIPNLFEAVNQAYSIATSKDFGEEIAVDQITYSTAESADICFKIHNTEGVDTVYSLKKIVDAIGILNERTAKMYPNAEDGRSVDIIGTEAVEPDPEPEDPETGA